MLLDCGGWILQLRSAIIAHGSTYVQLIRDVVPRQSVIDVEAVCVVRVDGQRRRRHRRSSQRNRSDAVEQVRRTRRVRNQASQPAHFIHSPEGAATHCDLLAHSRGGAARFVAPVHLSCVVRTRRPKYFSGHRSNCQDDLYNRRRSNLNTLIESPYPTL